MIPSQEFSISALCWGLLGLHALSWLESYWFCFMWREWCTALLSNIRHADLCEHHVSRICNSSIISWRVPMLPLQDHAILARTSSPSQQFLHPKAIQNGIALYRIPATFSVSIAFSLGFHLVPPTHASAVSGAATQVNCYCDGKTDISRVSRAFLFGEITWYSFMILFPQAPWVPKKYS